MRIFKATLFLDLESGTRGGESLCRNKLASENAVVLMKAPNMDSRLSRALQD